jgi:predicted Zn-dependent peptidase
MSKATMQSIEDFTKLITIPLDVKSLTTLVLVNTGSRYEGSGEEGIAHFFEHMVFKGTQKYPSQNILATKLDSIGADFNAFTSKEYTGFYIKAASNHHLLAIDVLTDMLFFSKLDETEIEKEKGVITEELNMYKDIPARYVADIFDRLVYQGGLSHDIIGTKKSIRSFNSQSFIDFLDNWYQANNMIFVLAGNRDLIEDEKKVMNIRNTILKKTSHRQNDKSLISIDKLLLDNPYSRKKLVLEKRDSEQAHLMMGWPSIKRGSNERYALMILSMIMGGNMSSRLFDQVRDQRGLCYYIHTFIDQFHDGGMFGVSAGVDPSRINEAIDVSLDEFNSLVTDKKIISKSELAKAKESIIGKMILSFEDTQSVAQFYGLRQLLLYELESPAEVIKKIRRVTKDEVVALANKILVLDELRFAIIGPYKDKALFNKYIK